MILSPATTQLYRQCLAAFLWVVAVGGSFSQSVYAIVIGGVRSEPLLSFFGIPAPLLLSFIIVSLALLAIWLITRSMTFAVLFAIIEIGGLLAMASSVGWYVVEIDTVFRMSGMPQAFEVLSSV
jgi:hypothetical protein